MAKKPRTTFSAKFQLDGARETLKRFKGLPKEASTELKQEALKLSEELARKAREQAMEAETPQAPLLVPTIRARKDRVPKIVVGGNKKIGPFRTPAYGVLFGAEFGSNQFRQFHHAHTGRKGLWFFPTVEAEQQQISDAWNEAADHVIAKFTGGGL